MRPASFNGPTRTAHVPLNLTNRRSASDHLRAADVAATGYLWASTALTAGA